MARHLSPRANARFARARDFLARVLADRGSTGGTGIWVPAPFAPVAAFLRAAARKGDRVAWCPPTGPGWAGVGASRRVARPSTANAEIVRVGEELEVIAYPRLDVPAPRFFGAVAFPEAARAASPWEDFDGGYFVLPRWTYLARPGGAALLFVPPNGSGGARLVARAISELDELTAALASADEPARRRARPPRITARDDLGAAKWASYIRAIRAQIARGFLEKVVAARATKVTLSKRVDPVTVFETLGGMAPDRFRFMLCAGRAAFLGATPERLFEKRGARLETHALAGTADIGDSEELPPTAYALLTSEKMRVEHQVVVRGIADALAPLCTGTACAERPAFRRFGRLVHLDTRITSRVRPGISAFDLLTALHPTPAVAGLPKERALDCIARHEPIPRGLYAGAVGFVDLRGDAEFAVAIRSGLVRGDEAYVYAGAGIVAGSNAAVEFEETRSKQQPFLRALAPQ